MQDVLAIKDLVIILLISFTLIGFFLCYFYKEKMEKVLDEVDVVGAPPSQTSGKSEVVPVGIPLEERV